MAYKYHNPVTQSNITSWVGAESHIRRTTSKDLILEFQRRLMKAVNDMLEFAGNKAAQRARHSIPSSLCLFYDGNKIVKQMIPLDRENLKSLLAILLHCPLQSSGLHSWKLAWKRKATARFLCWTLHLGHERSGFCEQPLSAKPYLVEYRQELLSLSAAKSQFTSFLTFFPWSSMDYWNTKRKAGYWVWPKFVHLINFFCFLHISG